MVAVRSKQERNDRPLLVGRARPAIGLLKTGQVAILLHVHVNTIRRWAKGGLIKVAVVDRRGRQWFSPLTVERILYPDIDRRAGWEHIADDSRRAIGYNVSVQAAAPELLTVAQAASLLSIHTSTARRWAEQGVLPAIRLGTRGDRRFERSDVERLLAQYQCGQETQS